jgi:hypothetical protein
LKWETLNLRSKFPFSKFFREDALKAYALMKQNDSFTSDLRPMLEELLNKLHGYEEKKKKRY